MAEEKPEENGCGVIFATNLTTHCSSGASGKECAMASKAKVNIAQGDIDAGWERSADERSWPDARRYSAE